MRRARRGSGDTLTIHPGPLHGAEIETYNDHRVAMCFGMLGLRVPGMRLSKPACVRKTFPNFFAKLAELGTVIEDAAANRSAATSCWPEGSETMSPVTLDKLKTVSTATAATALFKRGFRTQCIQNVHPLSPGQPVLVGPAFTLRYIPAREDLNKLDVFRDRSHPQRKAVEDCPPGAVMVMDSRKDARAASAGAILVTRMMKRGVAGVVTDGGFRDSAEIAALGIPAYHQRPSAPTNLTLHQAIDINVPIGCGDAPVFPGDIILGDQDGVIVIPANLLDEIADEAFEMTAYEDFVTEQVRAGKGIFGLYPATDPQSLVDFAAWRKANGR